MYRETVLSSDLCSVFRPPLLWDCWLSAAPAAGSFSRAGGCTRSWRQSAGAVTWLLVRASLCSCFWKERANLRRLNAGVCSPCRRVPCSLCSASCWPTAWFWYRCRCTNDEIYLPGWWETPRWLYLYYGSFLMSVDVHNWFAKLVITQSTIYGGRCPLVSQLLDWPADKQAVSPGQTSTHSAYLISSRSSTVLTWLRSMIVEISLARREISRCRSGTMLCENIFEFTATVSKLFKKMLFK